MIQPKIINTKIVFIISDTTQGDGEVGKQPFLKGSTGETSGRKGRAYVIFPECFDAILNWNELNRLSVLRP